MIDLSFNSKCAIANLCYSMLIKPRVSPSAVMWLIVTQHTNSLYGLWYSPNLMNFLNLKLFHLWPLFLEKSLPQCWIIFIPNKNQLYGEWHTYVTKVMHITYMHQLRDHINGTYFGRNLAWVEYKTDQIQVLLPKTYEFRNGL
jgi:hypothetical protein